MTFLVRRTLQLTVVFAILLQVAICQDYDFNNNGQPRNDGHGGRGIFDMILSPFRATLDQARRLLGHSLGGAQDVVSGSLDQVQMQTYQMFLSLYNKTYSPEELPRRMALFLKRREQIQQSVRDFVEGRLPFMMRENAFIDWDQSELKALAGASPPKSLSEMTPEEREAVMHRRQFNGAQGMTPEDNGPRVKRSIHDTYESSQPNFNNNNYDTDMIDGLGDPNMDPDELNITVKASIPASKDWRTSGCVSKPMNQLKCGACYAIASMSVLETMRCINKVSSPILSPQQIVDCSGRYKNFGCDGGWPTRVFKYLQDVGIAARESCYPFVRRQLSCRIRQVSASSGCTVNASPTDSSLRYKVLNNENDILYHVANTGPVVTVMRATDRFLYYGSGIFDDPKCTRRRDDVDHAIVIVGYGKENGVDYWLIKNSWGTTDWGLDGYGKYRRGKNACSIGHWGWVVTS